MAGGVRECGACSGREPDRQGDSDDDVKHGQRAPVVRGLLPHVPVAHQKRGGARPSARPGQNHRRLQVSLRATAAVFTSLIAKPLILKSLFL